MQLKVTTLVFLFTVSSFSASLDLSQSKNEISFLAIGKPSALRIRGRSKDPKALTGKLTLQNHSISGTAVLQVAALDTGIEMRDLHMKEKYLEVQKYSTVELQLSDIQVSANESDFTGTMILHGVSRPIKGNATVQLAGPKLSLTLKLALLITDFKIDIPAYLGIKVADEVKIEASAEGTIQ